MTSEFVASEMRDPSDFEPRRYRVAYRCALCGHEWKSGWRSTVPKKDPPCPNMHCAEMRALRQQAIENAHLKQMLAQQRAPGHIGDKPVVQIVDSTAKVVMEDYGLTDLKDNIREGETMAPKLPGQQQSQADNYFGATRDMKAPDMGTNRFRTIKASQLNTIAAFAKAGRYSRQAIPPNAVLPPEARNRPPLVSSGTRPNEGYVKR